MESETRSANQCLACGKETKNPKFCDRSCAAKYNNRTSPKRRPEGKCARCGAVNPCGRKYCEACRAELNRQAARKSENIRSWRTLAGVEKEAKIDRAWVSRTTVFDTHGPSLSAGTPSGQLIDRLIGICFAGAEYLRPDDARRHVVFLDHLKEFAFERYEWKRPSRVIQVKDIPIDGLSLALERWIFSFFGEGHHALMPSYALDTATFIERHAVGYYHYHPESWRIKPIVEDQDSRRELIRFCTPQFKKEFTERMGRSHVIARVPAGGRICDGSGTDFASEGDEFLASLSRCHLSSNFYDGYAYHYSSREENAGRYDISADFIFRSKVLSSRSALPRPPAAIDYFLNGRFDSRRGSGDQSGYFEVELDLPARWITHTVEYPENIWRNRTLQPELIPINWQVEMV